VLFNELPLDRTSVKKGENSLQVVTATRCVNIGLFLSNDLRRDVDVIIGIVQDDEIQTITFPGSTLRRVSPDERSIAFFLLKASTILNDLPENSEEIMDNGIVIKRTNLESLISQWPYGQVFVASNSSSSSIDDVRSSGGLFVYPRGVDIAQLDKYGSLKCTSTPERFILDVNLHFDKIEGS
jgi:tRNA pseudouridine-54 N-methylase